MLTLRRSPLWWALLADAVHAVIFIVPLALPVLYGPMNRTVLHDVLIYFDYASRAARGLIPYRDYVVEYPPLALPVLFLPRALTNDFGFYVLFFAAEMLLFDLLVLYLSARCVAERSGVSQIPGRLAWFTLYVAALYPLVAARYDMVPAAIAFAAAVWWFSDRPIAGGIAAAAGTFLKVYPIFIVGPAFLYETMRMSTSRLRGTVAYGGAAALGAAVSWYLGAAAFVRYQAERGLQIETLWAGLLMAVDKVSGVALRWEYKHTSAELVAPGAPVFAALAALLQAAALLLTVWRFHRAAYRDPLRFAGAAVLAFIVPGKVLSPQYLIWLIPFVTVMEGRAGAAARLVFLLSCVATTAVFPWMYVRLVAFDPLPVVLLNIRNALLLLLFMIMVAGPDASPTRSEEAWLARTG
jgi:hypothetical protein